MNRQHRRCWPKRVAAFTTFVLLGAGCSSSATDSALANPPEMRSPVAASTAPPTTARPSTAPASTAPPATLSPSTVAASTPASVVDPPVGPLTGVWSRVGACDELVAAMHDAGLDAVTDQWLVEAGFFSSIDEIDPTDRCRGSAPIQQSHFFTDSGEYGSRDPGGRQVDAGTYRLFEGIDTIVFPTHSSAFGYRIVVHYDISQDEAEFDVDVPSPCPERCIAATAWAISAFYPGAFHRMQ